MEKRYQVFVSSTFHDLVVERQHVMQALLELDCIPTGMELFPAADDSAWNLIKRVIDTCDYYIVILGGRYGSLSSDGISFTEKEYDYAVQIGIPTMGFLHPDVSELQNSRVEQAIKKRRQLEAFRAKVQNKITKYWRSPHELASVVKSSLLHQIAAKDRPGWVRSQTSLFNEYEREKLKLLGLEKELLAIKNELTKRESALEEDLRLKAAAAADKMKSAIAVQEAAEKAAREYRLMLSELAKRKSDELVSTSSRESAASADRALESFVTQGRVTLIFDRLGMRDIPCEMPVRDMLAAVADYTPRDQDQSGVAELGELAEHIQRIARRKLRDRYQDVDPVECRLKIGSLLDALSVLVVAGLINEFQFDSSLKDSKRMYVVSAMGRSFVVSKKL